MIEKYIEVKLFEVYQKDKIFYVGKICAKDLLDIYTVRPAKYDVKKNTELANLYSTEDEYYNELVSSNRDTISDKNFQRKYSKKRVDEVTNFLNEEEYAFFPNTIIANCELINDIESLQIDENSEIYDLYNLNSIPKHLSFFKKNENDYSLFIPRKPGSLLIIDGQHRLEGLKKADQAIKNDYELLIAFIIGYDRSVIAKQFYTINYQQKPVNRSLLYHLMGEFSTDLDELTFMHKVVKALNELENSPFYKRVKMLGVSSKELSVEDRRLQSISLAFLIDALSRSITKKVSSGIYQPIFRYYYYNERYQVEIIKFLINFFNAVSEKCSDWKDPSNSLLSKGMGVGAIIRLIYLIFPKIFIDEWDYKPEKIKDIKKDDIINYINGIENVDFSKDGPFGKTGSSGSVNKIKEKLVEEIHYLDCDSYDEFQIEFKKNNGVLDKYKKWLKNNVD